MVGTVWGKWGTVCLEGATYGIGRLLLLIIHNVSEKCGGKGLSPGNQDRVPSRECCLLWRNINSV